MSEFHIYEYIESQQEYLVNLEAMWKDPMVQLYNDEKLPPEDGLPSVFLNGPTSRRQIPELNHRCLSVKYLREAGFTGWIFAPEPRGRGVAGDFTERGPIYEWESSRRFTATCNSFWVPRDKGELLGLNTNFEWGFNTAQVMFDPTFRENGKFMVVGWPEHAERMGLPKHYSEGANIPIFGNQRSMCKHIAMILK